MKKNIIIIIGIVGLVGLLNFKFDFLKTKDKPKIGNSVEYHTVKKPDETLAISCGLYATYKGKRYDVIECPKDEDGISCIMLDTILDFDEDGLTDALIESVDGCGSAYIPSSYFICSPDRNMKFSTTENFGGEGYGDIKIEKWKGKPSIVLVSSVAGVGFTGLEEIIERYVVQNGKIKRVEKKYKKPIPSISELTSLKVSESEDGHAFILVNLDNDKLKDTIFGEYWDRWGAMMWGIGFGDGKTFDGNGEGRKRVGVLSSKTNGVNDIVLDFDDIMIWDGKKYKNKDKK
jgi:hypothetical protein